MDKLLIDISIILDVVLDREIDGHSTLILDLIDRNKAHGYLCANSFGTIYYLTNKYLDHRKATQIITDLTSLFKIAPVEEKTINLALKEKGGDFEDNIQIACAYLIKADFIITRNLSHFKNSPVKAITPGDYLKQLP